MKRFFDFLSRRSFSRIEFYGMIPVLFIWNEAGWTYGAFAALVLGTVHLLAKLLAETLP